MITKQEYFSIRTLASGEFLIEPKDVDNFPWNTRHGGSYNLAPARVLGLSYADYLRFLMQLFPDDVIVRGKGDIYPVPYWNKKSKEVYTFVKLLNAKMSLAMGQLEVLENE